MIPVLSTLRRLAPTAVVCAGVTGLLIPAAQARVFVGIGVPLFWPPAYYAPPPVYYPPPPVYYAPPPPVSYVPPNFSYGTANATLPRGQTCYAGSYTCPMDHPVPAGSSCYCLGNGGERVFGRSS